MPGKNRLVRRASLAAAALALVVAVLLGQVLSVHASGCQPVPLKVWPYRIVLDVAPTAKPGESLTYRVDYGREDERSTEPFGFVFEWTEGASFESARFLEGPEGVPVRQGANLVRWEFGGRPQSGAMEIVLKIDDDLSGDIAASAKYHRPGMPSAGSCPFQRTEVSENPPQRNREFEWMQHQVILSGPETAYSGDVAEYRIAYERTRSTGVPLGGLVFNWPEEAASLVSTDPQTKLSAMGPGAMDLGVGNAESGSIVVRLQIKRDFAGCLGVGWYLRGTSIMRQIGSVDYVQTEVVARPDAGDLPSAGEGARPEASKTVRIALALLVLVGLSLVAASAFLIRCRRRGH